jgi:glycosyltransferase involved in cell wall biosynthesis
VKIVQLIARVNRGGTASWLKELIIELRAENHEVILYAGFVQDNETEDQCFTDLGGTRIQGLGRAISIKEDFIAFQQIRKLLMSEKPDVVNTHTAKAGVIGRFAVLSLGRNRPAIVHTFHGHLLYGYFSKFKVLIFTFIEKLFSINTDVIIAAGERVQEELLNVGVGRAEQYVIARPGIEIGHLKSKIEVREKLGISQDPIVVGWLGRLAPIKRPDRVIELARELKDLIFVIGGEGELFLSLMKELPGNVKFLGWTTPEEIWAVSDIAFLTSDNEAQPISLIEAGLSGLPAVAENVGSVSEVIEDGVTGYLVNNFEKRRDSIQNLASNSELRNKMGNLAKEHCHVKFGKAQFLAAHLNAYELAIKRHNSKH